MDSASFAGVGGIADSGRGEDLIFIDRWFCCGIVQIREMIAKQGKTERRGSCEN